MECQMRAADEAELRLCLRILPDDRIAFLYALQFRIINDVNLCIFLDQGFALLLCLRRQVINVVKTDCTVGGSRCPEVLEIRTCIGIQLRAKPLIQPADIRYLLHDLHAYRTAEKLGVWQACGFHDDLPVRLSSFIRQEAELRHTADNGTEELQDAGVAVAAGTEHGVCIDYGRGLCPGKHVPFLRLVADFIEVAGTGEGIIIHEAKLSELFFIVLLLRIHEPLEHKILQDIGRYVGIQRSWIHGELLF